MQVILNKQMPAQPGRRERVRPVAKTPKTKSSGAKSNLPRQRKTTSIETPMFAPSWSPARLSGVGLTAGIILPPKAASGTILE